MFGTKARSVVLAALIFTSLIGSGADASLRPSNPPGFSDVSVSLFHTCALRADGRMFCWGDDVYGQLGDNDTSPKSHPVPVGEPIASKTVVAMDTGGYSTCAVTDAGELYCWGSNSAYGNLGDGTTTSRYVPTLINGGALAGKTVIDVSLEQFYGCALTSDHLVACWGVNTNGELGDGTTINRHTPVLVRGGDLAGQDITAVEVGDYNTCAITSSQQLLCWGRDIYLRAGNGFRKVPKSVMNGYLHLDYVATVSTHDHRCAVTGDSRVACWGYNTRGQIGDNSTDTRTTPKLINFGALEGRSVLNVTVGELGHTCAIRQLQSFDYGKAVCWGNNDSGQLGIGTTTESHVPVLVRSGALRRKNVKVISAGTYNTCAITVSNQVLCWGDNAFGQIGDGTTTDRLSARAVTWVE